MLKPKSRGESYPGNSPGWNDSTGICGRTGSKPQIDEKLVVQAQQWKAKLAQRNFRADQGKMGSLPDRYAERAKAASQGKICSYLSSLERIPCIRYAQILPNISIRANRPNTKWITDISYIYTKKFVFVHDLWLIWYCCIEAICTTNSQPRSGRAGYKERKRESLRSYDSTATKIFNTLHRGISTELNFIAFRRPCQAREIPMISCPLGTMLFFSILETECIYRHKSKTFQEVNSTVMSVFR